MSPTSQKMIIPGSFFMAFGTHDITFPVIFDFNRHFLFPHINEDIAYFPWVAYTQYFSV
jgi:hypothetical protein